MTLSGMDFRVKELVSRGNKRAKSPPFEKPGGQGGLSDVGPRLPVCEPRRGWVADSGCSWLRAVRYPPPLAPLKRGRCTFPSSLSGGRTPLNGRLCGNGTRYGCRCSVACGLFGLGGACRGAPMDPAAHRPAVHALGIQHLRAAEKLRGQGQAGASRFRSWIPAIFSGGSKTSLSRPSARSPSRPPHRSSTAGKSR
jgi:hypothetical protein